MFAKGRPDPKRKEQAARGAEIGEESLRKHIQFNIDPLTWDYNGSRGGKVLWDGLGNSGGIS